ncbi:penicillin-binding transpeptidase domain-containing protein [Natronospora cellulosivora (SeqCode)]
MISHPHLLIRKRILFLFLIFFFLIFSLSIRLIWIQVVNNEEYQRKALEQRTRDLAVEPKRGIIYDNKGRELAVSASSETVVAIPYEIKNPENTARQLADVLGMNYETVFARITRQASAVYVSRKIPDEIAAKVRKLDLAGITFTEESKRFYPKNNLASHIIGFAGIDSQGLDGLELSYDNYLRGTPGKIKTERDAAGRHIPDGYQEYVTPNDGYNLYLTIDEVIQFIAERELARAMNDFQISGGTVIVMDPSTGGLLAMANRPDYDPNNFANYAQRDWRNRAISDGFEPGSTFKIITTAAALEEGVVSENDQFFDPGYIRVGGERINCWKHGGHGSQTFAEVVENSCNPGFVQVGTRMETNVFYNYIQAFGFGSQTSIRLPGEARGILSSYDAVGPVEHATMTFGHGITVTPIQLVSAISAVANNGVLLQPKLVNEVRTSDGELVEKVETIQVRQVISEETATRTLSLLEKAVRDGTGHNAYIEGYRIGGKTGTAKHYGAEVYDTSFIGILPADDPQLVVLVVLYDVTGYPYYGSQTAAPIFRNIALDTLRYLEIPPQIARHEDDDDLIFNEVPDLKKKNIFEAEEILRKNGFGVKIIGDKNTVIRQVPLAGASVLSGTTILLFSEESSEQFMVIVPDLEGLNEEDARNLLAQLGLGISSQGSGIVKSQDIDSGIRVPAGTKINVLLEEGG